MEKVGWHLRPSKYPPRACRERNAEGKVLDLHGPEILDSRVT